MASDTTRDNDALFALTRRKLLGMTAGTAMGAAFAGALATLPGARVAAAQTGGKEFHSAWPYEIPPAGHFNLMQAVPHAIMGPNPTNIYADLMIQPMALYYWASAEWLPLMATEWSFQNGDTFSVTLRQGAKWSDGKDFTSKDVLSTFWTARILKNTVWQYVDKIEAADEYTVNFHMSVPSTVVQRYVLRFNIVSDADYGQFAQRAQDLVSGGGTMDDPDGKKLLDDLINFRPKDLIASGPFKFDVTSITNAQLTLVKNDSAWNADQVLFDKIVDYNGETPDITPVVLAKDVDYATQGFPVATEKQFQEEGIRVLRPPTYSGPALYINFAKLGEVFTKPVRQAIAMAVDRTQNGTVALGDSGIACKYMAGMSDNYVPLWMTDEDAASLNQYAYDQDKAASMLQEAGWTKDGDAWKTPDGKNAEFELIFPSEYADWSAAGQNLAEQLTQFGIKITPRGVTYTEEPLDVDKGNFELAIQSWGSSNNPHPHFSFAHDLFDHNTLAVNNGGKGIAFPLEQDTDSVGHVDLNQLTVDAAKGLDEDAQKTNVGTIAKAFNELLPIIPLFERYGNNPALEGVRVKAWPADDDPILKNSFYADGIVTMLMLTGKLEPV